MSYSALARKWRPKSFAELKGQDHVAKALMNALARNQLHHAYLFTGTRGVGKTTIARIFAKCLNCELGIVSIPCNQCEACKAIDSGRYLDLIEVDAASKTKVEDTRELLDNVQYAPASGRYKVYLIDEVHMLSGHSFNALLKTLEEPPLHVKFILATTDPEKIPVTILSRCLNFHLRALSDSEISEQLALILKQENKPYDEAALTLIARFAKGSVRDALSLLEQAISFCQDSVRLSDTELMLGMQYRQYLLPLVKAIFAKDIESGITLIEKMMSVGAEAEDVLAALLEQLYHFSIESLLPKKNELIAPDCGENREGNNPESLSRTLMRDSSEKGIPSAEVLQLLYQIGIQGQRDLPFTPSQRMGLEMTVLRMIAFFPDTNRVALPQTGEKVVSANTANKSVKTENESSRQVSQMAAGKPIANPVNNTKRAQEKSESITSEPVTSLQSSHINQENVSWNQIVEALPLAGLTRMLLKHCSVLKWHENSIHLALDVSQEPCLNQSRQTQIQQALSKYLDKQIHLKITCGENKDITPIQQDQKRNEKAQQDATSILLNDEKVQTIMKTFGATIEKVSYEDDN